jgi:hypothetical protein
VRILMLTDAEWSKYDVERVESVLTKEIRLLIEI